MKPQIQAVLTLARLIAVREALELICKGAGDKEAGRRALLLAFLISPDLIGTQRDLARRLGVSEGRASQMLKPLRQRYGQNSRTRLTSVKG